eukprot:SAG31_NODE_12782_length_917_cov_1.224939_1_plen_37_part_10
MEGGENFEARDCGPISWLMEVSEGLLGEPSPLVSPAW